MYKGDDLQYLNKAGDIPDICTIKKGVKRKNTFRDSRQFDLTSFAPDDTVKMQVEAAQAEDISESEEGAQSKEAEG